MITLYMGKAARLAVITYGIRQWPRAISSAHSWKPPMEPYNWQRCTSATEAGQSQAVLLDTVHVGGQAASAVHIYRHCKGVAPTALPNLDSPSGGTYR